MSLIHLENLTKHFKLLNRHPGLGGAVRDLFSSDNRFVFTFLLPIGFVAFYSSQLFLRPQDVSPLVYFSPLAGIALFALTYRVRTLGGNNDTGSGS